MGTRAVEKHAVSAAVAHNVKAIREGRNLSQAALAAKMGELGRPTQTTAIAKIEGMDRRVDVEDLVALAIALNVTPIRLLLPNTGTNMDAMVELLPRVTVPAWTAWAWAAGEHHLQQEEPKPNVTKKANRSLIVGWDDDLVRRELAYLDERPLWMRLGDSSELGKQLAHLTWAVRQALRYAPDVYGPGVAPTKAQRAGWGSWLPKVAQAASKINRTARELMEENADG